MVIIIFLCQITQLARVGTVSEKRDGSNGVHKGEVLCGDTFNAYTDRRWLPAQFVRLLTKYNWDIHYAINKEYSYKYSIQYTLQEIHTLAKLCRDDLLAYEERSQIFTLSACKSILEDYCDKTIDYINGLPTTGQNPIVKKIKGYGCVPAGRYTEEIKHIGKSRFVEDILQDSPEIIAIKREIRLMKQAIHNTMDYEELELVAIPPVRMSTAFERIIRVQKSKTFIDCFKKAGAYCTAKDLIKYEGYSWKGMYRYSALRLLKKELGQEGYQVFGAFRAEYGNFNLPNWN